MGPLHGIRVIELAGIGPGPFAAMLLADMGADVLRIDRVEPRESAGLHADPRKDLLNRGRRSVAVDLKKPEGVAVVLRLIAKADALIEGFRPGVTERLGLGPDVCLSVNSRLVYGRMTGYGQDGPLAQAPGHDINYIAIAGVLDAIGPAGGKPVPPLNLVGDFGGGGMMLGFGIACALIETSRSGRGQVVDASMVDGSALLTTMFHGMHALGMWQWNRGGNLLDGGAPFYDTYETSDGKFMAAGPIEPRFFGEFVKTLGIDATELPPQLDRSQWPQMKDRIAAIFRTRTQSQWCAAFDGSSACVTPVLSLEDAPSHPHNRERRTFIEYDGIVQPAPAPRFSRTSPAIQRPPPRVGEHTDTALGD